MIAPPPPKIPAASLQGIVQRFLNANPRRREITFLDDGEAELARQVVTLGILAMFEAARRTVPSPDFDRGHYEGVYVQLAHRFGGQAREALRDLSPSQVETFREVFLDQATRMSMGGGDSLRFATARRDLRAPARPATMPRPRPP